MVPFDKQSVTVVRQSKVGVDTTYEPPLRVGFGISDKTVDLAHAVMGRTVLVPGAGPNPTHYHANNDVCWYIMSGRIRCIQARSDCSERKEIILEAGDFVYIPSGAIHVIANASQTEEASLVFCYIGVPNVEASGNVWLTKEHDAFVAPGPTDMIDAHHHFWWTGRHAYSWPEQVGDRFARDFTPDDLRPELARAGVKGTVLIQVLHQVGGETEECLDLSKEVDFVRGVVGWLPLADPDATSRAIERLSARGGKLVGVRHLISNEPDPRWLLQDGVLESLKLLAAAKLAFDAIPVNTAQFESVLEVAGRLPELKMVINHLGRPPLPEQGWEPWATQVARAAEHRNVSMKLSIGLDIIMRWRWSTDAVRRYSDHVLDLFSPDRVMAASNWPVILLGASYAETWSGITELVAELSADERRAVLGGTAKRIYGL